MYELLTCLSKLKLVGGKLFYSCSCCCVQVWVICPTSDKRVNVEHLISKRAHKLIALRFWVRVWRLSCAVVATSMWAVPLAPPVIQQWYQGPGSTKGATEAVGPFAQKAAMAVQAVSVRLRRTQQRRYKASKNFPLKGGAWWNDGLTLEGECWTPYRSVEHLISKRTHKHIALRF